MSYYYYYIRDSDGTLSYTPKKYKTDWCQIAEKLLAEKEQWSVEKQELLDENHKLLAKNQRLSNENSSLCGAIDDASKVPIAAKLLLQRIAASENKVHSFANALEEAHSKDCMHPLLEYNLTILESMRSEAKAFVKKPWSKLELL